MKTRDVELKTFQHQPEGTVRSGPEHSEGEWFVNNAFFLSTIVPDSGTVPTQHHCTGRNIFGHFCSHGDMRRKDRQQRKEWKKY